MKPNGPRASLLLTLLVVAVVAAAPRSETSARTQTIDDLRSLPYVSPRSDAPRVGVLFHAAKLSQPGDNFFADRYANAATLLDNDGRVLHRWSYPGPASWGDAAVTPDGNVVVAAVWDTQKQAEYPQEKVFDNYLFALSPDSQLLWRRPVPSHHDVQLLPDGEILVLTERRRTVPAVGTYPIVDNGIARLSPNGNLIEELSIYDAVADSPLLELAPVALSASGSIDLFHSNSVQWIGALDLRHVTATPAQRRTLYAPDNYLFCSRHQNVVGLVNQGSRRLVWAWGQQQLSGPHAAKMLSNGNVLVLDNGLGRGASRVLELDPRTGRLAWQFAANPASDFYTATGGACQRLPNGNTMITDSWGFTAFEVTRGLRVVWKFVNPAKSFLYRMTRLPPGYFRPPFAATLARSVPPRQHGRGSASTPAPAAARTSPADTR